VDFSDLQENAGIKVCLDGQGRVYDNNFVERLWRSVKYEEVDFHDCQASPVVRIHLSDYFEFYNNERPHEALGYRTPHEVYFGARAALVPASEAVV
jgi:putative transposase